MAVTVNLKPKVDLPVWEWCRPLPVASTAVSTTCTSADDRYIYYLVGTAFYRYDTITDSWNQLASPFINQFVTAMQYSTSHGHYGRAIGNGGGANTIELAGLQGNVFVGKKIKIISGTGAGQERTITAISNPIIKDRGSVTSSSTTNFIDTNTGVMTKQWRVNQWRDYQVRSLYNTTAGGAVRPILYNNYTSLAVSDVAYASVTPWWGPTLPATTQGAIPSTTLFQIESNIATVNTNWNVQPDATSNFEIMSDGIWLLTGQNINSFIYLYYYDIAADMWFNKTTTAGVFNSQTSTDIAFNVIPNTTTPLLSGTVTSATSAILTDSSLSLTPTTYSNYKLQILSGTAIGQNRTITSNTSSAFFTTKNWGTTPAVGDTYGVYPDDDKLHIIGNGMSVIAQYSVDADFLYGGKLFDFGVARAATATVSGFEPFAISTITRTTGGISVLASTPTAAGTGYLVDQILTITTGGTGGTARITSVDAVGGVTGVVLETSGQTYTTGAGKTTSVVPAGGTGCTLNITTVAEIATVATVANHLFRIGDTVTIAGAAQADYNGAKTIISQGVTGPASTTFSYVVLNSPASPATYTNTQAATQLFDLAKNWTVNEHVGKLVVVTTLASPTTTAVVRRITANTANSLTFATITTPATNSTHRYAIILDKFFGTDETIGSAEAADSYSGRGNSGVVTSGTTTSLTDSSKNWPINYWSNNNPGAVGTGRKVRIIKGTGAGTEMIITSNTATTLNFATQTFTPDQTSVYIIMECFGIATAAAASSITDTTQNWGTNIWSGKRIRITGGTGVGQEFTINSNTQTVLNVVGNFSTTPDTTSTYAIMTQATRGAGICLFNITNSSSDSLNNKYLYSFRGNATNEITRYNLVTEQIDNITYFPFTETLTTGSMYAYDGVDRIYFTKDATGRVMYYDVVKNTVTNSSTVPFGMSTAIIGNRMDISKTTDGLKYLYMARHSGQEWWRTLLYW
jgi:hypothetical protein